MLLYVQLIPLESFRSSFLTYQGVLITIRQIIDCKASIFLNVAPALLYPEFDSVGSVRFDNDFV